MNRKNSMMGAIVLACVLLLGVGYAVASSINMNITGTANAAPAANDFQVGFDTSYTPVKTGGVVGTITNGTTATLTANLTSGANTGTATYKINNSSAELSATLGINIVNQDANATKYFDISYEIIDNKTLLPHGQSAFVKVTVTLKKVPVEDVTGQFSIRVTATATEA